MQLGFGGVVLKSHGKFFDGGDKLYHSKHGITILDENGKLKPEVMDILDIIQPKKYHSFHRSHLGYGTDRIGPTLCPCD